MGGSAHYNNRGLDFRGNNISVEDGKKLAADVSQRLGRNYDVKFETFKNSSNNHLHVEYDPKRTKFTPI
jgi:conjugal transfer mating pair stabilization protein TraG